MISTMIRPQHPNMSDDFVRNMRRRAKKKYTLKAVKKAAMMSGALPSPPADEMEDASALATRKNANAVNGTPPSAQRPPPSQDSPPGHVSPMDQTGITAANDAKRAPDDVDDDALLAATQSTQASATSEVCSQILLYCHVHADGVQGNVFGVLTSSQVIKARANPAARQPTTKWSVDEEWVVVEGMRQGLSQAQIYLNMSPTDRSASAIRGKKMDLQKRYGDNLQKLSSRDQLKPFIPSSPVPAVPPRRSWTSRDCKLLRTGISEGLSDRDIQNKYFPNRTEDSVLGKLRKLRNASVKKVAAELPRSRSQFLSSSPAVQRSSPAQAASKRRAEVVITDYLPVVHEEEPVDQDHAGKIEASEKRAEEADVDEADAEDDYEVYEHVEPGLDAADDDDLLLDDGDVQMNDADAVQAEKLDAEDDAVGQGVIPNSPVRSNGASLQASRHAIAFVQLPERPDLSDVIDLRAQPAVAKSGRAQPAVPNSGRADDRETKYAETKPPFQPGEENDKVGMLHSTKMSLWREAYSRCRGDAEKAYKKYDSLMTDEHMMQAVCNLDYEIINGIKAVRMRRKRENAAHEGKSPPVIPVHDQPQHLDLYGEKEYGEYYSYRPWDKETEDMYLNEPIVFGPRPVPVQPQEYIDPMHEAMRDDGDEEEEDADMDDGDDYEVHHSYDVEKEARYARQTSAKPFHGHISEIDDDEDDDSMNVIMSHRDAESASKTKKPKKKKQHVKAVPSPRKREHSSPEENVTPPVAKRQKKVKKQSAEDAIMSSPEEDVAASGREVSASPLPVETQEKDTEQHVAEESIASVDDNTAVRGEESMMSADERSEAPFEEQEEGVASEEEQIMAPLPGDEEGEDQNQPVAEESMASVEKSVASADEEDSMSAEEESVASLEEEKSVAFADEESAASVGEQAEETAASVATDSMPPPSTEQQDKKNRQPPSEGSMLSPGSFTEQVEAEQPAVNESVTPKKQQKEKQQPATEESNPSLNLEKHKGKPANEQSMVSPPATEAKKQRKPAARKEEITSPLAKQKKEAKATPTENTPPPSTTTANRPISKRQQSIEAGSMPPPAKKKRRSSKLLPMTNKNGKPLSKAALRRQKRVLRRSDASAASETSAEPSKVVDFKDSDSFYKGESPKGNVKGNDSVKKHIGKPQTPPTIVQTTTTEVFHPEDNPSQWMRDIVRNAKHKPPPAPRKSPPPIDPNNLFGRGDASSESENESDSDSE